MWSNAERLMAVDELIQICEPTQVRHMMQVIEPQFQRDFISLLPKEVSKLGHHLPNEWQYFVSVHIRLLFWFWVSCILWNIHDGSVFIDIIGFSQQWIYILNELQKNFSINYSLEWIKEITSPQTCLKKNSGNPQKLTVTNLNDSLYINTVRLCYIRKRLDCLKTTRYQSTRYIEGKILKK